MGSGGDGTTLRANERVRGETRRKRKRSSTMIPNYELFLHGFNTMPVLPEAAPMPVWMKLALGGLAGALSLLSIVVG